MKKYPNIKNCPENQFYDGIACISCPSRLPLFNLNYKLCMFCPVGSSYNADVK